MSGTTAGRDGLIRLQTDADRPGVRRVNESAFGQVDEADLVENLTAQGHVLLSAVAEIDRRIVGHILFSRMWIDTPEEEVAAVALAPMAVSPAHQRQGIGGRLIRFGLDGLRGSNERIVIVVGHRDYYPRFGFSTEETRFLESPFERGAFMALTLAAGALQDVRGKVRYPSAFGP
jgi:putative acetyltransferase